MRKGLYSLAGLCLAGAFTFGAHAATLKVAYDSDPVSLDPHEQLSGGTLSYSHLAFDPLVRYDQEHQFQARLAEKWERIDDTRMRFFLRKGVRFHSGNALTTKDVAWTFARLTESADFKAIFSPFKGLEVVDDYTFDLVTHEPYPLVLNAAAYIFPMDSQFYSGLDEQGEDKAALKKHGNTFASRNQSGTGPFKVSFRQQGVKLEMERFADYWDAQSPGNVDKLVITPIKEGPTRVAALLSGDVDMIAPVPPTDHERIKDDSKVDLVTLPGTRIITLQLNQNSQPAFKDARVRQAIVYAINNEGIVKKIMKGFATAAGQQSPQGYDGHNPALAPRYDLKKAKALMAEAGYADGFSVTMIAPNNRYVNDAKIAQAAASMLSKINIKVDLKTMPKAQYWPEYDARNGDIMMIGWHADTEDSANFSEFLTLCPNAETGFGQYNGGAYCNPEVDTLIQQATTMTDMAARADVLQQVEQKLYDDAAFVPLHWQNLAWAAQKNVQLAPVVNVMNFPYLGDLVVEE